MENERVQRVRNFLDAVWTSCCDIVLTCKIVGEHVLPFLRHSCPIPVRGPELKGDSVPMLELVLWKQ